MAEYTPTFVIPIEAHHVDEAVAERNTQGSDVFRKAEMDWLEKNNPRLRILVMRLFEGGIHRWGIDDATALMAGYLVANRTVRVVTDGFTDDYERANENYWRNYNTDRFADLPGKKPEMPWNTPEVLTRAFGSSDLAQSLMQIQETYTREGASLTIGMFCLAELPSIPLGSLSEDV